MSIRRPGSGGSREPQMADTTKAAAKAAKAPTTGEIERAREFAREPFLLEGEKPKDLAAGTPRRRALDAALAEIDEGHEAPSIEWRRDFSLMLGPERVLSGETPGLAGGAELRPHQADAPPGTLAALIAGGPESAAGRAGDKGGRGGGKGSGTAVVEAEPKPAGDEAGDDEEPAENGEGADLSEEEEEATEAEEAEDWTEEEDDDVVREAPEDQGASRRFWFEHATGAGKTVAAVGFIEASRTGGVLILTHRRN